MSSTSYTYVYYFVPLDGDTEEHMNVFLIRKPPAEVTVADIESSFPLPGKYFFRFKQVFQKTSHVWMDCSTTGGRRAPMFQGRVVCKVTRLAATSEPVPRARSEASEASAGASSQAPLAAGASAASAPPPAPAPPRAKKAAPAAATPLSLDSFGGGTPTPNPSPASSSGRRQTPTPAAPAAAAAAAAAAATPTGSQGQNHDDLLGLFSMPAADSPSVDSSAPTPFSPVKGRPQAGASHGAAFMQSATASAPMSRGPPLSMGSNIQSRGSVGAGRTSPAIASGASWSSGGSQPTSQQRRSPVAPEGNILTSTQGVNMW